MDKNKSMQMQPLKELKNLFKLHFPVFVNCRKYFVYKLTN